MFRTFGMIAFFVLAFSGLFAQAVPNPPVPSQFATAHTAFVGSGGVPVSPDSEKIVVGMMYRSFFNQMKKWGRFNLVERPQDAELAFELSANKVISEVSFGSSFNAVYLRVVVRDVKTHSLLWTIDEPLKGAFREKSFQQNVDKAMAEAVTDLETLAAGKLPDPN